MDCEEDYLCFFFAKRPWMKIRAWRSEDFKHGHTVKKLYLKFSQFWGLDLGCGSFLQCHVSLFSPNQAPRIDKQTFPSSYKFLNPSSAHVKMELMFGSDQKH